MYLLHLLFSFTGRINRESFLIGFGIYLLAGFVGMLLFNPDSIGAETFTAPKYPLGYKLWYLFWLIPMMAVFIKRANDAELPTWPAFVIGAVSAIFIGTGFTDALPGDFSIIQHLVVWPFVAFTLLALIAGALWPSNPDPNAHGPQPLYPQFLPF